MSRDAYLEATKRLEAAKQRLEPFRQKFPEVVANWKKAVVSGLGISQPFFVGLRSDVVSIDGTKHPKGRKLADALVAAQYALHGQNVVWQTVSDDEKRDLPPPEPYG